MLFTCDISVICIETGLVCCFVDILCDAYPKANSSSNVLLLWLPPQAKRTVYLVFSDEVQSDVWTFITFVGTKRLSENAVEINTFSFWDVLMKQVSFANQGCIYSIKIQ